MNRKQIMPENEQEQTARHEDAVRHHYLTNIVAALVCLALALSVWLIVMNTKDSDYVTLKMTGGNEAYEYTLSANAVEVEGSIADLKAVKSITVRIPAGLEPGEHIITEASLELPYGVHLTKTLDLRLTVREK
jgi:hypothetical protein